MEKIKIGRIVNVVGLKGAVKIYSYAAESSRFDVLDKVYIEDKEYKIKSVRHKGNTPILEFHGIENRNESENLRNKDVFMAEEDLEDTEEGEYYIKDLIGSKVMEGDREVGILEDVMQNGPQDIYDVRGPKGRVLIPGVPQFIKKIDIEAGKIEVELIEGMEE